QSSRSRRAIQLAADDSASSLLSMALLVQRVLCSLRRRILAVGLGHEVDQEACSSRHVFLYGSFADPEPCGDLLLRQVVHTSQPEYFTAFVRKPIDGGRDLSELLADADASLRR